MSLSRPLLVIAMLAVTVVRAEGQPGVQDAVFVAVKDHAVVLQLSDGTEQAGTLLSFDQDGAVLARAEAGEVVLLSRRDIVTVRLGTEPVRREPEPVGPPRYVGLQLGLAPSVMVDLDYERFSAFVNGSVLMPFFQTYTYNSFDGSASSGPTWAFTGGAGGSFTPFGSPHWRLDLYGLLGLTNLNATGSSFGDNPSASIGLGVGVHYTGSTGFTVGFKVPLVGLAFTGPSASQTDFSARLAQFYATHLVSLPIVSLGYRF